jgi:carbonic anhydrase/acetyltransferase-like protein (isoleucine patch superfamily)
MEEIIDKKYEITKESILFEGEILYRIRSLKNFRNVKKGDLGGFIQNETNLSHYDSCWIGDSAKVYGFAIVSGDSKVCQNAIVRDQARIEQDALIYGESIIEDSAYCWGNSEVFDNAHIYGEASLSGCSKVFNTSNVSGDSKVLGEANIYGNAFLSGSVVVMNKANIFGYTVLTKGIIEKDQNFLYKDGVSYNLDMDMLVLRDMNNTRRFLLTPPAEDDIREQVPEKYKWVLPILIEDLVSINDVEEDEEESELD